MDLARVGRISDGGGFTGAFTLGFRRAEKAAGIRVMYKQGVSVGALNEAENDVDRLREIWYRVAREGPNKIFPRHERLWRYSLQKNSLYTHLGINWLLSFIDFPRLVAGVQTEVVVFNDETQERVVFSTTSEEFQRYPLRFAGPLRASVSLKGILPPVYIKGIPYSDGIHFMIDRAIDAGCRTILIYLNEPIKSSPQPNANAIKRMLISFRERHRLHNQSEIRHTEDISQNLRLLDGCLARMEDLSLIQRWIVGAAVQRLRFTFAGKFPVDLVVFRSDHDIPTLDTLEFGRGGIELADANGYEVGMRTFDEILRS